MKINNVIENIDYLLKHVTTENPGINAILNQLRMSHTLPDLKEDHSSLIFTNINFALWGAKKNIPPNSTKFLKLEQVILRFVFFSHEFQIYILRITIFLKYIDYFNFQ